MANCIISRAQLSYAFQRVNYVPSRHGSLSATAQGSCWGAVAWEFVMHNEINAYNSNKQHNENN